MCVVLSSIDRENSDEHLIDKSAILCSLNIKAMNFEDSVGLLSGDACPIAPDDIVLIENSKLNVNKHYDIKNKCLFGTHVPILSELSKLFKKK